MARLTEAARRLSAYTDWLLTVGLAVAISILGLTQNASAQTVSAATLLVLGAFAIGAIRDRMTARRLQRTLDRLPESVRFAIADSELVDDARRTGLTRILPQTVNVNWLPEIDAARHVSIAKLKLNFTEDPEYFLAFERVLRRGGQVSIILADPRAPAMWLRYLEEPRGEPQQAGSETAWVMGLEELAAEILRLNTWRLRIRDTTDGTRLFIGLFPHYPTHAFYQFDDRLYVFHYPYMARGFHAPAFLFTARDAPVHTFLTRCHRSVRDDSIPLTDDVAADVAARYRSGTLSDAAVARSELRIIRRRRAS